MHQVEGTGREGRRGEVLPAHRQDVVGEDVEEAGVGVHGQDGAGRAGAPGQQLGDAARARPQLGAPPAGSQPERVGEPHRGLVVERGEAGQPLPLGVPGRVEDVAGVGSGGGRGGGGHGCLLGVDGVGVGHRGQRVTVSWSRRVPVVAGLAESVTRTVTVQEPTRVGTPVTAPLAPSRSPGGSAPEASAHR